MTIMQRKCFSILLGFLSNSFSNQRVRVAFTKKVGIVKLIPQQSS